MTADQRDWIIILASASAICDVWGTIVVLVSYFQSASAAESIWNAAYAKNGWVARQSLAQWASFPELANAVQPLRKKRWMTFGLFAYIFGAIFGLIAVILGVT